MSSFTGERGPGGNRKGPVSQRDLLRLMKVLIDASMGKVGSTSRDQARWTLRQLLAVSNWKTPRVLMGLGARRCRYLSILGYVIESKWLTVRPGDVERLMAYGEGRRRGGS